MNLVPEPLRQVIVQILTPLIRILLRNGVAYGTFSDIVRKIYVDVAFRETERQGQKTTISNVSILTGINRKEVKRLRESETATSEVPLKKANRLVRVLAAWQIEPDFLDAENQPLELPIEGDKVSFTALVRRFSGDMPVVAMLNALRDAGHVEMVGQERVRLVKHSLLPQVDTEQKLILLGTDTAELIETIDHNMQVQDSKDTWFQAKAWNVQVRCSELDVLKQRINRQALQLLKAVDADFSEHETNDENDRCQVAVGIYFHTKKSDSLEDPVQ